MEIKNRQTKLDEMTLDYKQWKNSIHTLQTTLKIRIAEQARQVRQAKQRDIIWLTIELESCQNKLLKMTRECKFEQDQIPILKNNLQALIDQENTEIDLETEDSDGSEYSDYPDEFDEIEEELNEISQFYIHEENGLQEKIIEHVQIYK